MEYNPDNLDERLRLAEEIRSVCSKYGFTISNSGDVSCGAEEIWSLRHGEFVMCVRTTITFGEMRHRGKDSLRVYAYKTSLDGQILPGKGYGSQGADDRTCKIHRVGTHSEITERLEQAIRKVRFMCQNPAPHTV